MNWSHTRPIQILQDLPIWGYKSLCTLHGLESPMWSDPVVLCLSFAPTGDTGSIWKHCELSWLKGEGWSWYLVGRGQRCCGHRTKESFPQQRVIWLQTSVVLSWRNPFSSHSPTLWMPLLPPASFFAMFLSYWPSCCSLNRCLSFLHLILYHIVPTVGTFSPKTSLFAPLHFCSWVLGFQTTWLEHPHTIRSGRTYMVSWDPPLFLPSLFHSL